MRALAFGAGALEVVAIAPVDEFVLVAIKKGGGEGGIAREGVEAGAGGEVAKEIGVIGEVTLAESAGGDGAFGIEDGLVAMIFIDVGPPGLGVRDEGDARIFLEHLVEALEAVIIHLELPMHQDGHAVGLGELVNLLHRGGVAFHAEFLFSDHDGAALEIFLDLGGGAIDVGHFVRCEGKFLRMRFGELVARFVAGAFRLKAVGDAVVGGLGVHGTARGEQDGLGDAHRALVLEQDIVGSIAVGDVLMDIDDGLGFGRARTTRERSADNGESGGVEEVATGKTGLPFCIGRKKLVHGRSLGKAGEVFKRERQETLQKGGIFRM